MMMQLLSSFGRSDVWPVGMQLEANRVLQSFRRALIASKFCAKIFAS
jgi:hypothetical protein